MENKQIYKEIEGIDFKSNLCYNSSLYQPVEIKINKEKEINIDPIFNLLQHYKEIIQILSEPQF